jgi:hypothetical protein
VEIISEYGTWFMILAIVFGFYMTWGIGANDVANAMGTSVGSGAITVKQAIIIAAILTRNPSSVVPRSCFSVCSPHYWLRLSG